MKIAYIAGCYTGKTTYEIRNNIRAAEKVAEWCWLHNIVAVCPHTNSAFLDGLCPYHVWAEGYLELLKRLGFDFMILVPGWEKSRGTLKEIELANQIGLPIYKYGDAFGNLYDMENNYMDLERLLK